MALVRQCLHVIFCLSITFSKLSFLDTGKPKPISFKRSFCSVTDFVTGFFLVTCSVCHSPTRSVQASGVQRMMGTSGDCSVHDCPLSFTAAEINYTFYPDKPFLLKPSHVHDNTTTLLPPWYCEIDGAFTYQVKQLPNTLEWAMSLYFCKTFKLCINYFKRNNLKSHPELTFWKRYRL